VNAIGLLLNVKPGRRVSGGGKTARESEWFL
jgi:hypothetical protein